MNLSKTYTKSESDGFLLSFNNIYKAGTLLRRDTIDQEKINRTETRIWTSRISYTEPITKKVTAEISYSINYNANDNNRKSLDKDAGGKYSILAQDFSNNFEFRTTVHTPGLSFKYDHKKIKASIGTRVGLNEFNQKDVTNDTRIKYNFTNIFPTASINVKMKGNTGFGINYNGSGIAPTLNQLQPIQDNNNPFNIFVGNPDLKQSFTHNISGNYNSWNVIKNKNIWSYFNINTQQNAYTNDSRVDSFGRNIRKTVNVNGNYNGNLGFSYNFKIKPINMGFGFGPTLNINNRNDFVNGQKNNSKTNSYGIRINMDKWVEDKNGGTLFGFWMEHTLTQNDNKASINQNSSANFRMLTGNLDMNVKITKKINLNTELQYEARQKDPRFPQNNNFALWNSSLQYEIVKGTFSMEFKIRDILNQNRGFNRSFSSFNFTESFYNTLRRFWLLTATYKFNSQKIKSKTNAK